MSLTLDQNGNALTETIEGVTMPIDYSFANVNDFVHSIETQYEDLECLCLGMANNIEKTSKDVAALKENVRLADMLIAKIDDKKYRQMIATYRTLVKAI
ncbi:MAG: hypothetical protein ACJAUY_000652 [Cognaticolwellia sp.]|jgi:uncharacterized protein YoxC